MRTSASNRRLRILLTAITKGALIPQPDFQRRLVWSNANKVEFIKTVLSGYPFPEIYIAAGEVDANTGEGIELLVDGQQRITTLYEYFKGSNAIKLNDIPPYQDLNDEQKREFLEYEVVVRDLGDIPLDNVKQIFQKINSTSYGLNAMEIHNARYDGEFKRFGEDLSLNPFFEKNNVFSPTDIKRMKDVTYSLSLVVTVLSSYFERDKGLEEFLEKYNESFEQKDILIVRFNEIFDIISRMECSSHRLFKKNDLFTLVVELYNFLFVQNKKLNILETNRNLNEFYSNVDLGVNSESEVARNYFNAVVQGSNNRSSRILRGNIISNFLVQM